MSLVEIADVRALIKTGESNTNLQALIDRIEDDIVRRFGAHYVGGSTTVEESVEGGAENIYLRRRIGSVDTITERVYLGDTATELEATDYYAWAAQGRIQRLPEGRAWGRLVTVTFVPHDDNAQRKQVIIDLVRLDLERTGKQSENVAGEYSYTAPEWELERARLLRRLSFLGF